MAIGDRDSIGLVGGFYIGRGDPIRPYYAVAESDAERLDAYARFFANGCFTGDCPHRSADECAFSVFSEAQRVYEETT